MLTTLELLKRTTEFFEKKGVPNARLDAELLIASVLKLKRLDLYLQHERPLEEKTLEALRPLVKRRGDREPLQYILGEVEWGSLRLKVDRRALIPRHETEELWELIIEAHGDTPPKTILDVGTGTGALALALKKSFPAAAVLALDRSAEALSLAQENSALNSLRVDFLQSNYFAQLPDAEKFNLIVSNPPYLTEAEVASAEPEVKDFEPREALIASDEGFADLAQIIREGFAHLTLGGALWLEMGIAHGLRVQELGAACGYTEVRIHRDRSGRDRFAFLRR